MSKGSFKFKLNGTGVGQMLKSPEAMSICEQYAHEIQNRAGEGYEVTTVVGKYRARASVYAATVAARQDNYNNNTLLKSLGGGK